MTLGRVNVIHNPLALVRLTFSFGRSLCIYLPVLRSVPVNLPTQR